MNNPCLSCGACCSYFRVSFYWNEAESRRIPAAMTVPVTPHRFAMRGTEQPPPRCVALQGTVGNRVNCGIYESRPSPCRSVMPSWYDGKPDEQCDKARTGRGLPPLQPSAPTTSPPLADIPLPDVA